MQQRSCFKTYTASKDIKNILRNKQRINNAATLISRRDIGEYSVVQEQSQRVEHLEPSRKEITGVRIRGARDENVAEWSQRVDVCKCTIATT